MSTSDPFHEGERAAQERAGSRARAEQLGRVNIRRFMLPQQQAFFEQLPFVVVGALDGEARPWASVLTGRPGFMQANDPCHLAIRAHPGEGDALQSLLVGGAPIALLGIEAHTRRRSRVNGTLVHADGDHVEIHVAQSYGNCSRYIHARKAEWTPGTSRVREARILTRLDADELRLIAHADTFYIASAHPAATHPHVSRAHGVDVSHRSGKPGFVVSDNDAVLTVPDFAGNSYFNTVGNLICYPYAGLLFIDFERGDILQLLVRGEVIWDGTALKSHPGAERLMRFEVVRGCRILNALPLVWGAAEMCPFLAY